MGTGDTQQSDIVSIVASKSISIRAWVVTIVKPSGLLSGPVGSGAVDSAI